MNPVFNCFSSASCELDVQLSCHFSVNLPGCRVFYGFWIYFINLSSPILPIWSFQRRYEASLIHFTMLSGYYNHVLFTHCSLQLTPLIPSTFSFLLFLIFFSSWMFQLLFLRMLVFWQKFYRFSSIKFCYNHVSVPPYNPSSILMFYLPYLPVYSISSIRFSSLDVTESR